MHLAEMLAASELRLKVVEYLCQTKVLEHAEGEEHAASRESRSQPPCRPHRAHGEVNEKLRWTVNPRVNDSPPRNG